MSIVHHPISQQQSSIHQSSDLSTNSLSQHQQLLNNSALSSPNSLNHLNKLNALSSGNTLPTNSVAIAQAAQACALAACDSLRNYNGAFNMANVLNGHRLFNQQQPNSLTGGNPKSNSSSDQDCNNGKLNKTSIKNENSSTLNHLGNLEGLFNKVGNKTLFSIDHLLNSSNKNANDKKQNASNLSDNSLSNGSTKNNYQLMAAARQQLAAMQTALGFGLNDKLFGLNDKSMSSDAQAAQLSEFYNQFLGANSYMNAAAALNNFANNNFTHNSGALSANNPLSNNPFTNSNFHQAANLLSSANLTPPPNSNSPMNEDEEKVCVDEQVEDEKDQIDDDNEDELRSTMHSPFSVASARSGRSSTVNIEEDCD